MDRNRHIRAALDMAKRMNELADLGEIDSEDDGCAVLYGVIRDCGYKIRSQAEQEKERHRINGVWSDEKEGLKEEKK